MKAMSFDATLRELLGQRKFCTRRGTAGAWKVRPGDYLRAVARRQLRAGEKARTIAVLRVTDVRPAPALSDEEVALEGYAGKSVQFLETILRNMWADRPLVRIAFDYVAIAAPALREVAADRLGERPEILAELNLAWDGKLAALPRGDPGRRQLRELQRLGRTETLLLPETFALFCGSLGLEPIDLWRMPGGAPEAPRARRPRSSRKNRQLQLFPE